MKKNLLNGPKESDFEVLSLLKIISLLQSLAMFQSFKKYSDFREWQLLVMNKICPQLLLIEVVIRIARQKYVKQSMKSTFFRIKSNSPTNISKLSKDLYGLNDCMGETLKETKLQIVIGIPMTICIQIFTNRSIHMCCVKVICFLLKQISISTICSSSLKYSQYLLLLLKVYHHYLWQIYSYQVNFSNTFCIV